MKLNKKILRQVESELRIKIIAWHTISGGSINHTWCLHSVTTKYFIKINNRKLYPGMFEAEASGLALMSAVATIAVPKVLLKGEVDNEAYLLLQWIDARRPTTRALGTLGKELAQMHRHTAMYFGLDSNNYMGSLHQSNSKHQTWASFFIEERLQPMLKMAIDQQYLNSNDINDFETLYKKLPGLFEEEAPSLLHGDLWSGNYLIGADEKPYLIDPAVCYGHREFDMAMTTLFGGFSEQFYIAYHEAFPLAKGWEQRVDLWNLYPLLLHLNLFGPGYLEQVRGGGEEFYLVGQIPGK